MSINRENLTYPTDYECSICYDNPLKEKDTEYCTWYGHTLVKQNQKKGIIHAICQKCWPIIQEQDQILYRCCECRTPFPEGRAILVISKEGRLISNTNQQGNELYLENIQQDLFYKVTLPYLVGSAFFGTIYGLTLLITLPDIPTRTIFGIIPGTTTELPYDSGDGSTITLVRNHRELDSVKSSIRIAAITLSGFAIAAIAIHGAILAYQKARQWRGI